MVSMAAPAAQASAQSLATRPIVVGVDESAGAAAALDWAVREAAARHVPLRIVHASNRQRPAPWSAAIDRRATAEQLRASGVLVGRFADRARGHEGLDIGTHIADGYAPDVLTAEADAAGLMVVGSHRLSSPHRLAPGSVANAVSAHSACPVVVVWDPDARVADNTVVIAVAGDTQDEDVLAFGFAYADRHGLPVHAVHCWQPSPIADQLQPVPHGVQHELAQTLAEWRTAYPDVPLRATVIRARAVEGLVETSRGRALLVVGRRSRHLFTALVGSTCAGVAHHAECTVAIVPRPLGI